MAILDLNHEPDEGDVEVLPDLNEALGEDGHSDDAQAEDDNHFVQQGDEQSTGTIISIPEFTFCANHGTVNHKGSPSSF